MIRHSERYLTLDGARGLAAISVFLLHLSHALGSDLFPRGYLAVDFFFMLSGFVVAAAYEDRLRSGLSPTAFMARRLGRIYPLYALGAALGALAALARPPQFGTIPPQEIVAAASLALLLLPGGPRGVPDLFSLNSPAWSLFFEMIANAVYGAAAPWLTTRRLAAATLLAFLVLAGTALGPDGVDGGSRWSDWPVGLARVGFAFPAGVLLYRLRRAAPLRRSNLGAAAVLAGLTLLLSVEPATPLFDLLVVGLGFPLVLATGAAVQPTGAASRIAGRMGGLSYALYAVHAPVLALAASALVRLQPPLGSAALVMCLSTFAAAWLAEALWDRPAQAWLAGRRRLRSLAAAEVP